METNNSKKRRRRTQNRMIEDPTAREVTFSKRRKGLFNKASELAILCGVECAIIAYSPHGNPFAFSTSSVDAIIGTYLSGEVQAAAIDFSTAGPAWWDEPVDTNAMTINELENYVPSLEEVRKTQAEKIEKADSSSSNSTRSGVDEISRQEKREEEPPSLPNSEVDDMIRELLYNEPAWDELLTLEILDGLLG